VRHVTPWLKNAKIRASFACHAETFIAHQPCFDAYQSLYGLKLPPKRVPPQALLNLM